MKLRGVFVAALLLLPTAALAAPGMVTESVGMRAGPGPGFPTVDRIPGGAHVNIHGCIRGDAWCDVSWSGDRGWVSSEYLEYLYRHRYVYLPDYVDEIDVPIVPFVLSSYWASYYPDRPWYHRRAYWSSYWQSHARFATQVPADRSARIGRTESRTGARTAVTEGRTRAGVSAAVTREPRLAHVRGAQAAQEQRRLAHVNGAGRTVQQPIARAHQATRFSAAPAARHAMPAHIAQPNVGRANVGHVGGPPMNARAQMGAPHAAPAMPHVGGGAPHVNAAPHVGGGAPAGGGGPGHKQH
jgi:uncharacterized protein YraI